MAYKVFVLDESTQVTIYKRRASRNMRLSVLPNGHVRVSIPAWAPYKSGLMFVKSKQGWIKKQHRPQILLSDGQAIGKAHRLRFIASPTSTRVATRLNPGAAVVTYPAEWSPDDSRVQAAAETVGIRALRAQAEQLLPQRLAELAKRHNFTYSSLQVKNLKSRWGSCDHKTNIVLNLYLMQLSWEYIDYVLLHELMHTRILRHGPDFWNAMGEIVPNLAEVRKAMRTQQPLLHSLDSSGVT